MGYKSDGTFTQVPGQRLNELGKDQKFGTYDEDTLEFMQAVDAFKASSGRRFPLVSDYLNILKQLGYKKEIKDGLDVGH